MMNAASDRLLRRHIFFGLVVVGVLGASLQPTATNAAMGPNPAAVLLTPFSTTGAVPVVITRGPDGNLWFTLYGSAAIGRITPAGIVTEFPLPSSPLASGPIGITAGPDGNLWFAESAANRIGRITPTGVITVFPIPTPDSNPAHITAGVDGNLWFTAPGSNRIGRITPTGVITEFPLPPPPSGPFSGPWGITAGPDGNLWFAEIDSNRIGRITPTGVITEFSIPTPDSRPRLITAGPDGNLWFDQTLISVGVPVTSGIGRITSNGVITEFRLPQAFGSVGGLTTGPDGNLWVIGAELARVTAAGDITRLPLPTISTLGGLPAGIALGSDGSLWFTDSFRNRIYRVTVTTQLSLSPPSGIYLTTQRFEPTVIVAPGPAVIGGQMLVNGVDVTSSAAGCLVAGQLTGGGQTFRCRDVSGGTLGPGRHRFCVLLQLANGSTLSSEVVWDLLPTTES